MRLVTAVGPAIGTVRAFLFAKLGGCPRCMRTSLRVAAVAWAGVAAVHVAGLSDPYWYASLAATAGLTSLWFLHILTFGLRSLTVPRTATAELIHADRIGAYAVPGSQLTASRTRREMLQLFVRSTLVAATASLALTTPASARCGDCARNNQAGWHDCITHFCNTTGQYCCPPGFPYLNHCNCLCYQSTNFGDAPCGSYSNCNYCY